MWTKEHVLELRLRFRGDQERDEAIAELLAFGRDKTQHGGDRMRAASAVMDLKQGWDVAKNLRRFRRDVGIDPVKAKPG